MSLDNNLLQILNSLSDEVNHLYGLVNIPGENYGEPAINSGPCGPFAYTFYKIWNGMFNEKVHIVFIMKKNVDECWHVLIRLPNGMLFDGGYGVHSEKQYQEKFDIIDMQKFDIQLLEKNSFGLNREYPRYCPNFSLKIIEKIINKHLKLIETLQVDSK